MVEPLPVVRTVPALRETVAGWRAAGARVALVPTMGALHAGHLSLVRLAREHAERVVASVFVNPTQFAPTEDFDAYPRDLERDAGLLAAAGCDLLYAPDRAAMYPDGFATTVAVAGVSEPLDGAARPGHFAGVATVVTKLLTQASPDVAVFGEKDWQQLTVIRRLVADLDLPVQVVGASIAREPDGLAMSSRNAYLSAEERPRATTMSRVLEEAANAIGAGAAPEAACADAVRALEQAGFGPIDYVEARTAADLTPWRPDAPARLFAAARLGRTRLIDNWPVPFPPT